MEAKDKVIADLAFNLGNYIYQFTAQNKKSQADELIDIAMDDIDGTLENGLALKVRAQIVRGYQSAEEFALSQVPRKMGLVAKG